MVNMSKKKMFNIMDHQGNANHNNSEMEILTLVRMAIIKKTRDISVGEDVEKKENLCVLLVAM